MHRVVEDQVQTRQAGGFSGEISRKDAATIFPMACATFGISSVPEPAGRVCTRVFAAGVAVVVFDQVFKDGGVEVEFLREDAFEAEIGRAC